MTPSSSTGTASSSSLRFATVCASIMLWGISLGCLAFCAYSISGQKSHLYVRLAPAAVGIAAPALLRFDVIVRLLAASVVAGLGTGLYAAQLFALMLTDPDRPALQAIQKEAKLAGVAFDSRTRVEAIDDFRHHGVRAYPPFYPYLLLDSPLKVDGQPTVVLSSLANATSVVCNDNGQYLVYTTDEHGFPNPPGSWTEKSIDVALVGASGAVGECVPPAENLAAQLRLRYPRTVIVGAGGNGPLLELASVREYLPMVRPKRVLWIFSESHTPEYLESEGRSPFLKRYLDDPSYTRHLYDRQIPINAAVSEYFEEGIKAEEVAEGWRKKLHDFLVLKDFRTVLYYFVTAKTAKPKALQFDAELYQRVIQEGQKEIASWGGTLTLVYWPDSSRYAGICSYSPGLRQTYDRMHDAMTKVANDLHIPVIDVSKAFPDVPAAQSAENSRYFYPFPAHPKPEGYHVIGNAILEDLERGR